MRVENIEVTLKIPFREVDCNGFEYSESAIKEACKKAEKLPLKAVVNDVVAIIGIANEISYDEESKCITVKGIIKSGGTCETVEFDENGVIESMNIIEIGITE